MKLFFVSYFILLISCVSQPKNFEITWPTKIHSVNRVMTASHDGIDIATPVNTPVYAAHKGIVVGTSYSSSYGKYIILENGRWATLYAHLTKILVKRKDEVEYQQLIGYSGNTGKSTGPHLHFEILKNKKPVNPLSILNKK